MIVNRIGKIGVVWSSFLFFAIARQQFPNPPQIDKDLVEAELRQNIRKINLTTSLASPWLDATFYSLNLHVAASPLYLAGAVTIQGTCGQDFPQSLVLDLMSNMRVDSVHLGGIGVGFLQQTASLIIPVDSSYHAGDLIAVDVFYQGTPSGTGLGSFIFGSHLGTPWIWSLSEPYGARDWWPCKDQPNDKADSADITITCDSAFSVGSNGRLVGVRENGDGTKTFSWQERYPIATYLVSVALTNFAQFSNWYQYAPSESLEVLNYVLPENLTAAQNQLPNAVDGLRIFSDLFGQYPFIREKYGHAQFGAGAMEHQTMTSTSTFNEAIIIHELAHQWFGDMITCRTWSHLWLNEGFATYCTALYHEKKYGAQRYSDFINGQLGSARIAAGPVYMRDTTDVRRLFNGPLVYAKGAAILHMLRHVVGDSLFFQSMYSYANDPLLKYRTATTEDFRLIVERTSGKDLGYFFDEWIYGENYPHYTYSWNVADSSGSRVLMVTLSQTTGTSSPTYFTMPIDLRMVGGRWDSTITVYNDAPRQIYTFVVPTIIDSLQLDPGGWILKDAVEDPSGLKPAQFALDQNYPNPFNLSTTIRYRVPHRSRITLEILNILGQHVSTLEIGIRAIGSYTAEWDATGLPSGVYFCRFVASDLTDPGRTVAQIKPMVLLK